MKFLLCILLATVSHVLSVPIDNGVIGDPEIHCGSESITVNFNLQRRFGGHVYVKGLFEADECRTTENAQGNEFAQIEIGFDQCNTVRTRSLEPRGVFVTSTVVIKFHPLVITKIDKAVRVQCFYMEADKTVDTSLEVSMITTDFQTVNVPMPVCRYEILDETPTGAPVRFALIGQKLYHKWTCDTDTLDIFCMYVYGCYVNEDTRGDGDNVIQLLDDNGCALDENLLGDLEYPSDLMGGVQAHAFKYADRPYLYFNCQINIQVKEPGLECPRPECPGSGGARRSDSRSRGRGGRRGRGGSRGGRRRGKRQAESAGTVDVRYPEGILIADVEMSEKDVPKALLHPVAPQPSTSSKPKAQQPSAEDFCFSPAGFGLMATFVGTFMLSALTAILILSIKKQKRN